jgi:beta-glucosidase
MTNGTSPGAGLPFPPGFTWGAATAAYQVEGAAAAGGRGPSVWDTFSHTPGKVRGGDTGDIACDSYHRYAEDADLIKSLGLSAYRFSISWPRILPVGEGGKGAVNQVGLDYYKRLLDALAEREISPAVTLFHWDTPQALQDKGGWASRDTAQRFAEYAFIVGAELGDRVANWITLNEPHVVAHNGHRTGVHAPGLTDGAVAAAVTHHLLLGHGLAASALRAVIPAGKDVGVTLSLTPVRLGPDAPEDLQHAARVTDASINGLFLSPLLYRRYPEHALPEVLPPAGLIHDGDLKVIGAPLDFLGVNYYRPIHLRHGDPARLLLGEEPAVAGFDGIVQFHPAELERTNMGWLIDPEGLYELLLRLSKDAPGLPLYITENGRAAEDYQGTDGVVNDLERIKFLHQHLHAAACAVKDGANLAGYYVWSLLDNFEWAYGYQKRFGIVYVDFATQNRVPKASASFYAGVARANAVPPLPAKWPV